MTEWTRLTEEPFFSDDGSLVTIIGNDAEMNAMGNALGNALGDTYGGHMAAVMRGTYVGMAREGRIQVAQVNAPTGELVAVARLYVASADTNPHVAVRFLRGRGNAALSGDSSAAAALASYLEAVNTGLLEVAPFGSAGFSAVAAPAAEEVPTVPAQPLTPYQAAMQAAAVYNETAGEGQRITAVQALAMGLGRVAVQVPALVEEVPAEVERTWEVPVEFREYAGDIKIVPINSIGGLKHVGQELENQYFIPHKAAEGENFVRQGGYIPCVVKVGGTTEALAEYAVQAGSIVLRSLTGYAGENVTTGPIAQAAVRFARELSLGVEGQTLFPNGNRLTTQDAELELTTDLAAIPYAQRMYPGNAGAVAQTYEGNGGYDAPEEEDEDEEDDEEHEEEAETEAEAMLTWDSLYAEGYVADNGLRIEIVSNIDGLARIGAAMHNPLSDTGTAERYARYAMDGEMQHYAVWDGDNMVGCGSLIVVGGNVECFGRHNGFDVRPFGTMGADAPARVNIAINEFVSMVRREEIDTDIDVDEDGFDVEKPEVGFRR